MPDILSDRKEGKNLENSIYLSDIDCDKTNGRECVITKTDSQQLESHGSDSSSHYSFSNTSPDSIMFELNHVGRLPPLASVFNQEKIPISVDSSFYDKHNNSKTDLKYYGLPFLGKSKPDKLTNLFETTQNSKSFPSYSEYFQQTIKLPNYYHQNICGVDSDSSPLLMQSNTKISRKRLHSGFYRESSIPPNVNAAFKKLRNLIPTEPADRRLSKVETLRLAVSYIQHLGQTLSSDLWEEQPCLVKKTNDIGDLRSTPICTFCMGKKRKININTR